MSERFYLLGADVSGSPTPRMVNAAFEAMGIDAVYSSLNVATDALASTFSKLKELEAKGLNVTMPHKSSIISLLDSVDATSTKIGAVNTVAKVGDLYLGHNTDVEGITGPLRARGVSTFGRAVVVGTGGAARAFCAAMAEMGCRRVTVLTRDVVRARSFVSDMAAAFPNLGLDTALLGDPVAFDADLVFNASPMGSDSVPSSKSVVALVRPDQVVFDAVYFPVETELIRMAEGAGARTIRGYEMLLGQAIGAVRIWTGRSPPSEVMSRALVTTLEARAR